MKVVIGIDPHMASHTAVALDEGEDGLSSVEVRATRRQVEQLLTWPEPFEKRTWAIESRKVAEGKTKMEAIRALKRHISNAVYRQVLLDAR